MTQIFVVGVCMLRGDFGELRECGKFAKKHLEIFENKENNSHEWNNDVIVVSHTLAAQEKRRAKTPILGGIGSSLDGSWYGQVGVDAQGVCDYREGSVSLCCMNNVLEIVRFDISIVLR